MLPLGLGALWWLLYTNLRDRYRLKKELAKIDQSGSPD
jgi:hypothetical protein